MAPLIGFVYSEVTFKCLQIDAQDSSDEYSCRALRICSLNTYSAGLAFMIFPIACFISGFIPGIQLPNALQVKSIITTYTVISVIQTVKKMFATYIS